MSKNDSPSKRSKKRTLADLNDNDNDDNDITPPNKKRKLNNNNNNNNSNTDNSNNNNDNNIETKDQKSENDQDDIKPNDNTNSDFKIVCYNLNGVRAAARKQLEEYITEENADIVCFSEMKARLDQNPCKFSGYQVIWYECTEKAGYAGTAVLTKIKPLSIKKGIGAEDGQGRAITLEYKTFYLINTYVPNSGQKLKFSDRRKAWDIKMNEHIKELQKKKPVIWTGDLNVAILDFDVYDGETNKNRVKSPGFTPYERENFRNILSDNNLIDSYRKLYPKERKNHFTFFSNRSRGTDMKKENRGWRLDYFVVSESIIKLIDDIQIRKDKSCSDHVPLVLCMKNPNSL